MSGDNDEFDYLLKIVVIGDSGVGKTNLIHRFTKDAFNITTRPTIGVDFSPKTLKVDGLIIKAQFWDTAGQEKYRSMTTSFYKNSAGAILVFDITKRESFSSVASWLRDIREYTHEKIPAVLIGIMVGDTLGNKLDLAEERVVTQEEAQTFAEREGLFFMEASALTNQEDNVSKAFTALVKDIVHVKETAPDPPTEVLVQSNNEPGQAPVRLVSQPVKLEPEEKKGCC